MNVRFNKKYKIRDKMISQKNISAQRAHTKIQQKSSSPQFILLDVRTSLQHCISHIPQSINISSSSIEQKLSQLNKEKQYLVYCRSGARSNSTAQLMRKNGFVNVTNMIGGMNKWNQYKYQTTSGCAIM